DRRPAGETDFRIPPADYVRDILRCRACGVYMNRHDMLPEGMYDSDYYDITYGDGLRAKFERIMSLPSGESTNKQRVQRIIDFLARRESRPADTSVLDVGSGLCVFPAQLKRRGFYCELLDPGKASVALAMELAGVDRAYTCEFDRFTPSRRYHLVTLNKVIEHVRDPVAMLRRALSCLKEGGLIYMELPDGDRALAAGGPIDREEFYIDHHFVFTPRSVRCLVRQAGLEIIETQQLYETTDKFTIYAFLSAASGSSIVGERSCCKTCGKQSHDDERGCS
ncbi:MAG: class I SAM-dependent methyltransferase, partial [Candidatus Eisenbacteria sp.]|nr:class I SAM-dependent methyltransferase [Candidatus Eisenbacteria bacterium]